MSNLTEEKIVSKYGHETISLDSEDIEKLLQGKELYNTDFDEYSFSVVVEEPVRTIPLDRIKQTREEIEKKVYEYSGSGNEVTQAYCDGFKDSLAILDRLIAESEG